MFITCIDSYSKYLVVKEIQNKLNIETKATKTEPSFSSTQFKSFAQSCGINLYFADPRYRERAHSTLTEIARCIKDKLNLVDYSEIIIKADQNYNMTMHSITNQRPYDLLYNKIEHDTIPQILRENAKFSQQRQKGKGLSRRGSHL